MGCIAGAVIGLACGLISWLVATSTLNGGLINVTVRCKLVHIIMIPRSHCIMSITDFGRGL